MKGETDTYDVVVTASGFPDCQFPAHRALLAARSPWFRDTLLEMARSDDPGAVVVVPGITPAMLHIAIGYLYRDELVLPTVELPALSSASAPTPVSPAWPYVYDYARRSTSTLQSHFAPYASRYLMYW